MVRIPSRASSLITRFHGNYRLASSGFDILIPKIDADLHLYSWFDFFYLEMYN
jgi:hypothetical protein